ncbi:MAG: glutamyl-tRNA amidotransferase [Gammaproteobacteria bacterium RIFCSPLOWO2_02_FULL_52_10]|nr:MAG: glutamyl-tRNA amidotransferase [Gammaproteobacteria bacterium RIFCSPLOWO2_02_FULL_52_10]
MSGLKQRLNDEVKSAMRSQNKERLAILRVIMAALKQKEVDERIELDDSHVLSILDKLAKQHRDSIEQFKNGGRDDLVKKETGELQVVLEFMPTPLTDAEIEQIIRETITAAGATGVKEMGKVMSQLKPRVQGRADMGKVSGMVKQLLS